MVLNSCILCFFGLILSAKSVEIKVKERGIAVFHLPPFSKCGTYSLMDARTKVVLTVFNGTHAQLSADYEKRAYHTLLVNETMLGLHQVTISDTGTFYIQPESGLNCNQYYYSLSLIDATPSWLEWSEWSACSLTCGINGERRRYRNCTKLGQCQGQHIDRERCTLESCPRHAYWSTWTQWSECNSACGQGMRNRTRTCSDAYIGCHGNPLEREVCHGRPCVLAAWTTWSRWTTCSQTCNGGTSYRIRNCSPLQDDRRTGACIGDDKQTVECNAMPCYGQGGGQRSLPRYSWSSWSPWSLCRQSCGNEVRRRERSCMNDVTNSKAQPSYCGSDVTEQDGSCDLPACKKIIQHGSDGGSEESSGQSTAKDIGVTVPLSGIVGTVAAFFILVLMVIVIALVTRLRKKNRTRANDVISGGGGHPTCQERGNNSRTKVKKVVSICEESDSHCYAEIDDDIIVKRNKSKSVITLDNPYSDLPRSASPSSKTPNGQAGAQYANALNEERVFLFENKNNCHDGAGSRHLGYAGHGIPGCGNQSFTDAVNGMYITPTSREDNIDRKPQKYLKPKTYVKPTKK